MPTLQTVLLVGPVLLFSMVAHEIAHGYVALKQGDRTALEAGRLSWNPIRHIDPVLTLLLPLLMLAGSSAIGRGFVIGGAKPVPVNAANYRHPRRGDILVSLAGVTANLAVAVACVVLVALLGMLGHVAEGLSTTLGILQAMFIIGIWINAGLIAFNLLPIPPLDGSHVVMHLLPRPLAAAYARFGRFGILLLIFAMVMWPRGLDLWLTPTQHAASASIESLVTRGLVLPTAAPWLK
ncbi:MAG TPA: site-2 protease family protein [Gemmatimonadaceae bacterium]|nr:site-2 protease family protein [Gemmatimonadaceae bacterium]